MHCLAPPFKMALLRTYVGTAADQCSLAVTRQPDASHLASQILRPAGKQLIFTVNDSGTLRTHSMISWSDIRTITILCSMVAKPNSGPPSRVKPPPAVAAATLPLPAAPDPSPEELLSTGRPDIACLSLSLCATRLRGVVIAMRMDPSGTRQQSLNWRGKVDHCRRSLPARFCYKVEWNYKLSVQKPERQRNGHARKKQFGSPWM